MEKGNQGLMSQIILISIGILGAGALWTAFVQGCPAIQGKEVMLLLAAFGILSLIELWETFTISAIEEVITAAGRASVYLFLITELSPYKLLAYLTASLIVGLAIYAAMKKESA
jgi:hypothetical protein